MISRHLFLRLSSFGRYKKIKSDSPTWKSLTKQQMTVFPYQILSHIRDISASIDCSVHISTQTHTHTLKCKARASTNGFVKTKIKQIMHIPLNFRVIYKKKMLIIRRRLAAHDIRTVNAINRSIGNHLFWLVSFFFSRLCAFNLATSVAFTFGHEIPNKYLNRFNTNHYISYRKTEIIYPRICWWNGNRRDSHSSQPQT